MMKTKQTKGNAVKSKINVEPLHQELSRLCKQHRIDGMFVLAAKDGHIWASSSISTDSTKLLCDAVHHTWNGRLVEVHNKILADKKKGGKAK